MPTPATVTNSTKDQKQLFAIDGDCTRTLRDWSFAKGVGEGSPMTKAKNWAEKYGHSAAIRGDGSAVCFLCCNKKVTRWTVPAGKVRLVSVREFILSNHPELAAVI